MTPTLIKPTKELLKGDFGVKKNDRFGLLWGSLSLRPRKDFQVEVGVLTTMVGQELPLTTDNKNIAFGSFGTPNLLSTGELGLTIGREATFSTLNTTLDGSLTEAVKTGP